MAETVSTVLLRILAEDRATKELEATLSALVDIPAKEFGSLTGTVSKLRDALEEATSKATKQNEALEAIAKNPAFTPLINQLIEANVKTQEWEKSLNRVKLSYDNLTTSQAGPVATRLNQTRQGVGFNDLRRSLTQEDVRAEEAQSQAQLKARQQQRATEMKRVEAEFRLDEQIIELRRKAKQDELNRFKRQADEQLRYEEAFATQKKAEQQRQHAAEMKRLEVEHAEKEKRATDLMRFQHQAEETIRAEEKQQRQRDLDRFAVQADKYMAEEEDRLKPRQGHLKSSFDIAIGGFGLMSAGRIAGQLGATGAESALNTASNLTLTVSSLEALANTARAAGAVLQTLPGIFGNVAVSGGLLAVAVTGVVIAFDQASKTIKKGQDDLNVALEGQKNFYKFLVIATTEDANKRIEALKKEREAAVKYLEDITLAVARTEAMSTTTGNVVADVATFIGKSLGFKELSDRYKETEADLLKINTELKPLESGLNTASFSAQDAAKHELELAKIRTNEYQKAVQGAVEQARLVETATSKQIEDRIRLNGVEMHAILNNEKILNEISDSKEREKALEAAHNRFVELTIETNNLQNATLPLIIARENETKAAEESKKAIEERNQLEEKRFKDLVSATDKYNADVEKLKASELEARAKLEETYAERMLDAARKQAQAEEDALANLKEKQADLALDLERDLAKADRKLKADEEKKKIDLQVKKQTESAKAYRDHLSKLQDIQESFADREQDALFERNFLDLYRIQRDKSRAIEKENQSFAERQADRAEQFRQQIEDAKIQHQNERAERIIAYHEALQDAQIKYNREIESQRQQRQRTESLTQAGYNRDLQGLSSKITAELALRGKGYQSELQMLMQTEQVRNNIFIATLKQASDQLNAMGMRNAVADQALANQANQAVKNKTGSMQNWGYGQYAMGGFMASTGVVNEPWSSGQESFTNSKGTINFPGFGTFSPLSPGTVNANRGAGNAGNVSVSMPINIYGASDPVRTGQIVKQQVANVLREILE